MPAKSMADSADGFCSASAAFLPPRRRTSWWYTSTLSRFLTPRPSHSRIHPPFLLPCPLRPPSGISSLYPPLPSPAFHRSPLLRLPLLRLRSACRDPSIRSSLYLRVPFAWGSRKRMGLPSPPSSRFAPIQGNGLLLRGNTMPMKEGCVLRNRRSRR